MSWFFGPSAVEVELAALRGQIEEVLAESRTLKTEQSHLTAAVVDLQIAVTAICAYIAVHGDGEALAALESKIRSSGAERTVGST